MFKIPKYRRSSSAMKRLYNRISRYYRFISGSLDTIYDVVIREKISKIPDVSSSTVLEYACGSGNLTLKLSPVFKSVNARDLSVNMLSVAKERAGTQYTNIEFSEGNLLDIDEKEKSYDYCFISFALHLFPLETEKMILKRLYAVAKKAVIIIDHERKWDFPNAVVEWLEGGYYDQFIKYDFKKIADEIGCKNVTEEAFEKCMVLTFYV